MKIKKLLSLFRKAVLRSGYSCFFCKLPTMVDYLVGQRIVERVLEQILPG